MDVHYPYAEGIARLRLLYRLPLPLSTSRLIQVCEGGAPVSVWAGSVERVSVEALLRGAVEVQPGVDAVALPGTWDIARTGVDAAAVLFAAHRLLRPGGVVLGHCENVLALRALCSMAGWHRLLRSALGRGHAATARGYMRTMAVAGFESVECSFVQPHLADPMGLIPTDTAAARAQFLRVTRAERGHFNAAAYAARIGLAWAGLGGVQQGHLFFWGYKAC